MIIIYVHLLSRFNVSIAYHQCPPPNPTRAPPLPSPPSIFLFLPAFPAITLSPGRFPSLFPHVSLLSLSLSCARHRSFPLRLRVSSLTCYSGGCGVDGGGGGGGSFPSSLRSLFSCSGLFSLSFSTFISCVLFFLLSLWLLCFFFFSILCICISFILSLCPSCPHHVSPLPFFPRVPSPFSPLQPRHPLAPQAKITN